MNLRPWQWRCFRATGPHSVPISIRKTHSNSGIWTKTYVIPLWVISKPLKIEFLAYILTFPDLSYKSLDDLYMLAWNWIFVLQCFVFVVLVCHLKLYVLSCFMRKSWKLWGSWSFGLLSYGLFFLGYRRMSRDHS